ncbi:MAG: TolC family protein [Betaproteobacteria bacterium]
MNDRALSALLAAVLAGALAGCAVSTPRLDAVERKRLADDSQRRLFDAQEPIAGPLTLAEAMARALKYQAEHRQRQMEEAAAAAQLEVAQFDLLPRIAANAGYSWRNNEAFGFGFTPAGTIAATPSASVERNRNTASLGLSWSILDFGVSYFRARQLSDQKLIAQERRRKAVQTLMHDVRVAWWRAEAAERLLPDSDRLLAEVEGAIEKTRLIEAHKLLPPVQTATLRRALLDLSQQIAFRRQDLMQAKVDLAALVNAPPGADLRVAVLPRAERRAVPDLTANVEKLEALALEQRPELAEEGYRARISADEARKALIALLPNVTFDIGTNYDSNRFLVNNSWLSAGANIVVNLAKLASLPALNRSEEAQKRADEARRLAVAMAILAQTHLAAVRYTLVADEYFVWEEATRDDDLIVEYLASSERVGIDNELELIRARARAMASHINRGLAYANVQAAIARIFNSVGYDAVPEQDEAKAVSELAGQMAQRIGELERASFQVRARASRPQAAVDTVRGGSAQIAGLVREGAERVLATARVHAAEASRADVQLDLELAIEPAREGRRNARVAITARPGPSGAPLTREFRTTLSEPVDEEQWRVLGEGAIYRIIGEISTVRITRSALRADERLSAPQDPVHATFLAAQEEERGEPLALRLDVELDATSVEDSTIRK